MEGCKDIRQTLFIPIVTESQLTTCDPLLLVALMENIYVIPATTLLTSIDVVVRFCTSFAVSVTFSSPFPYVYITRRRVNGRSPV